MYICTYMIENRLWLYSANISKSLNWRNVTTRLCFRQLSHELFFDVVSNLAECHTIIMHWVAICTNRAHPKTSFSICDNYRQITFLMSYVLSIVESKSMSFFPLHQRISTLDSVWVRYTKHPTLCAQQLTWGIERIVVAFWNSTRYLPAINVTRFDQ